MVLTNYLVKLVHVIFVLCVLLVPFFGSREDLELYTLIIPFLLLHWTLNNDICALTELEKVVKGTNDTNKTFMGKVIGPIYKLDDTVVNEMAKMISFMLWAFVMFKLHRKDYICFEAYFINVLNT